MRWLRRRRPAEFWVWGYCRPCSREKDAKEWVSLLGWIITLEGGQADLNILRYGKWWWWVVSLASLVLVSYSRFEFKLRGVVGVDEGGASCTLNEVPLVYRCYRDGGSLWREMRLSFVVEIEMEILMTWVFSPHCRRVFSRVCGWVDVVS